MSRLKKFSHQIRTANVQDINRVLQEIQLRLDSLEGIGQDKDMNGQRIIRVGDPTQDRDAINRRTAMDMVGDAETLSLTENESPGREALGIDTIESELYGGLLQIDRASEFAELKALIHALSDQQAAAKSCEDEWARALLLEGPAPALIGWDDVRGPLITGKPGGTAPNWAQFTDNGAGSTGLYAYHFDDGEEIFIQFQMPHAWKPGSLVYPHIHWAPTTANAGNVGLGIEYVWIDYQGAIGNSTIATVDAAVPGLADEAQITKVPAAGVSGAGHGISAILYCRIFRQAATAGVNYADQIYMTDVDVHFQTDGLGSNGEFTK
jgi:hypothetical protein